MKVFLTSLTQKSHWQYQQENNLKSHEIEAIQQCDTFFGISREVGGWANILVDAISEKYIFAVTIRSNIIFSFLLVRRSQKNVRFCKSHVFTHQTKKVFMCKEKKYERISKIVQCVYRNNYNGITKKKPWEKKEQFTLYSALLTVSFVQLLLSFQRNTRSKQQLSLYVHFPQQTFKYALH